MVYFGTCGQDRAYTLEMADLMSPFRRIMLYPVLLMVTTAAIAQTNPDCPAPAKLDDGWATSEPQEQGLDPRLICAIGARLSAWKDANVHAIVIARHGVLVYEKYFAGEDQNWGKRLGRIDYDANMVHDLRSVTKSVTSLMVGIALDRGWIKSLDAPVLSFFPEYADLRSPEREQITLRHLLMMAAGLEWDETIPYSNPENSENKLYEAVDPYRYVLERPVADPPGKVFNYITGAPTLISAVLHKATGKQIDHLEKQVLFDPLGIKQAESTRFGNGDTMGGGGLRLRPRDVAKIGQLVVAYGMWSGQQVVPAVWIEESTKPRLNANGMYFYGYYWWLGRSLLDGRQIDWIAGRGYGGQRLIIVPSEDMVMVVMAGNYDTSPLQEIVSLSLLNRLVLPATRNR
jgi:CubicO group peptidase (beta-lactamase class C family)